MTRGIRLMVFDMAGTTVEDGGQVPAAFAAALAPCGIALTEAQLGNVRGASKREAIAELVERHAGPQWQSRSDEIYASFVHHLERAFGAGVNALPGAAATFAELRARGIKIALTTGFDRDIAQLLTAALGWRSSADCLICGDDVPRGRPAPYLIFQAMQTTGIDSVHAVGAIGDTVLDLQAAYNAGTRLNIGALSGAHDRAKMERAPHTHLVAGVAELPALLASL